MPIIHLWSLFSPTDPDAQRRHALAQSTWASQPWRELPVDDATLPRLFDENGRKLPFVRDLFDRAADGGPSTGIVIFTNADIGVVWDAAFRIALALQVNGAGYSFRRDFGRLSAVPSDITQGADYPGTDLFFFRVGWWQKHRAQMPDMLLAREAWDACLRVLIEKTCPNKPLALPNICWHERHGGNGHWEGAANRYSLPGQLHNLKLAKAALTGWGYNPASFGIV